MRSILNRLAAGLLLTVAARAELVCTSSQSVAASGETIHLRAFDPDAPGSVPYNWSATGGKLKAQGAEADWTAGAADEGAWFSIKVGANGADCTVQVGITGGSRGDRETGRTLLVRGKSEEPGYGLYSYLLLGSPPDDGTRERYKRIVTEYLQLSPALADLRKLLDPKQLNANYLPVMTAPKEGDRVTADWLLTNYDYARARAILRTLPGSHFRGPYLFSTFTPADPKTASAGPVFFQDLSTVPLDLVPQWYEVFLNQAAQQRFWDVKTGQQMALRVRTIIGVLAQGLPDVKSSLASWIQWLH